MKQNNKKLAIGLALVGLIGLSYSYFNNYSMVKAAPLSPADYIDFGPTTTPGAHILRGNSTDIDGNIVELPGEYGTIFKINPDTSYEVSGNQDYINVGDVKKSNGTIAKTKYYRFKPFSSSLPENEKPTVKIKNAGVFQGKTIDLKLVIDSVDLTGAEGEYFNFIAVHPEDAELTPTQMNYPVSDSYAKTWAELFLFLGSGNRNTGSTMNPLYDLYIQGNSAEYHYEFYYSDDNTKIDDFKGVWNFGNINRQKAVSVEHSDMTDFSDVYIREYDSSASPVNYIGVKKDYKNNVATPNFVEFGAAGSAAFTPNSKISKLIGGDNIDMGVQYRHTSRGPMAIVYDSNSLVRIAPSRPIVFGEKNSTAHGQSGYKDLRYTIRQATSPNTYDNGIDNRNDAFEIQSEVPDYYDIHKDSVKVYQYPSGVEATSLFNIETTGNTVRIIARDPKSDEFDGEVFDVKVVAKPNATFNLPANKTLYGYMESGDLNGYMTNFEMGGPKTKVVYSYATKKNVALESLEIEGQTKSQVRYDGIPSANARENITYPVGINWVTEFGTDLDNRTKIEADLIKDIAVDTENFPHDEITSIKLDSTRLPDTSTERDVVVYVILTTAQGVEATVPVTITLEQGNADLTVRFVDETDNDITGFGPVILTGTIGETANLTNEPEVTDVLAALTAAGYDIVANGKPANETAVAFEEGGSTVKYILAKAKSTITVEFYYVSKQGVETAIQEVAPVVLNNKEVATSVDLTLETSVMDAISTIVNTGRFTLLNTGRPSDETAVVVERTNKTVKYIFTGQLKLESVPTLDFRKQAITATDAVKVDNPSLIDNENYTAADNVDHKDKLIVSDYRSVANGWTLSVKLLSPLLPDEANPNTAYVLADAIRYDTGSEEVIITEDLRDIVSETHEGQYDVSSTWTPAGKGFKLELPAGAVNKMGKYKATMQYVLANTP
ncbi:WxL domain-containing protein [Candidatus Enterococcus clewellii]|uniref:Uncharacterized protein n=1 Tax=Candidatus Enterococcus clewellii TaxID=1834193 RepID=A0A242K7J0_9ENTE|nr:WxL domain-containing protein [Enterococcus sp. 9E7_DIV0242]OTP16073.1 hypothetical protein A5888_002287 [Enterococcus sp. 9E7_DIV0242]